MNNSNKSNGRSQSKPDSQNKKKNNKNKNKNNNKGKQSKGQAFVAPAASAIEYKSIGARVQTFRKGGRPSTRIQRREFIGKITRNPTAAYELLYQLPINPGMAVTFPWLSTQAQGWEQYCFNSLRFEYVPRCSSNTSGSLTMGPDYDANDPAPSSSPVLADYQDAKELSCWAPLNVPLDRGALMTPSKRKFIRSGPKPLEDIKTYDCGNFFITADGISSVTQEWGSLFVEYDVTFYVPCLEGGSNALVTAPSQASRFNRNGSYTVLTGVASTLSWNAANFNALAVGGVLPTTDLIPLNGAYFVVIQFQIDSDAATAITITGGFGGTATGFWSPIKATEAVPGLASSYSYSSTGIFLGDGVKTINYSVTVTGTGALSVSNASIVFLAC